MNSPSPGWYPDPDMPCNWRWWNGYAWAAAEAGPPGSITPPPSAPAVPTPSFHPASLPPASFPPSSHPPASLPPTSYPALPTPYEAKPTCDDAHTWGPGGTASLGVLNARTDVSPAPPDAPPPSGSPLATATPAAEAPAWKRQEANNPWGRHGSALNPDLWRQASSGSPPTTPTGSGEILTSSKPSPGPSWETGNVGGAMVPASLSPLPDLGGVGPIPPLPDKYHEPERERSSRRAFLVAASMGAGAVGLGAGALLARPGDRTIETVAPGGLWRMRHLASWGVQATPGQEGLPPEVLFSITSQQTTLRIQNLDRYPGGVALIKGGTFKDVNVAGTVHQFSTAAQGQRSLWGGYVPAGNGASIRITAFTPVGSPLPSEVTEALKGLQFA